jgi:hypothetical protein
MRLHVRVNPGELARSKCRESSRPVRNLTTKFSNTRASELLLVLSATTWWQWNQLFVSMLG